MRLPPLVLLAALALLVGPGATSAQSGPASLAARSIHVTRHGLSVTLPAGWHAARTSLTPHLTDPREELSVATVPLRYRAGGCAHVPVSGLRSIGSRGAFVTLQERGLDPAATWTDFPARPTHFGPRLGGPSEAAACVPGARFTDHWFGFTDAGRHFHVLVAFGPRASATTRRQAWAILDGLRVDPTVVPDWKSAG